MVITQSICMLCVIDYFSVPVAKIPQLHVRSYVGVVSGLSVVMEVARTF